MNQLFGNIPPVVKNLLILNILFFIAQLAIPEYMGMLKLHHFSSELFKPWQLATHFFMHSERDFTHILFNMLFLVWFGSHLERVWGPKKFLILYMASAMGAALLHLGVGYYEIYSIKSALSSTDLSEFMSSYEEVWSSGNLAYKNDALNQLNVLLHIPMVGASGAVFGILAAFAYLFPNTEIHLYFLFPVKAKWLIGVYALREIYLAFADLPGDNVAHFAHLGGAIVGLALVLIWRQNRNSFY